MYFESGSKALHWKIASQLLNKVATALHRKGQTLWVPEQVSVIGLKSAYQLEQMRLIYDRNKVTGVVFVLENDEIFWPEVTNNDSLFFHKLAIDPELQRNGMGDEAIHLIKEEALEKRKPWLRVDCDDRIQLRSFYERNGFKFVDAKLLDGFNVVRYQRPIFQNF